MNDRGHNEEHTEETRRFLYEHEKYILFVLMLCDNIKISATGDSKKVILDSSNILCELPKGELARLIVLHLPRNFSVIYVENRDEVWVRNRDKGEDHNRDFKSDEERRVLELDFPKSVSSKFEGFDFPQNEDWGVTNDTLPNRDDIKSGENAETLVYARALDVARQSGVTPDIQVAIASAAANIAKSFQPNVTYHLRGVDINADEKTVTFSFGAGNKKATLTAKDIAKYHIPSISGYDRKKSQDVLTHKASDNYPEALLQMATNPKKDNTNILINPLSMSDKLIGLSIGQRLKDDKIKLLAQFPIDRLNLSEEERELLLTGNEGFYKVFLERKKVKEFEEEVFPEGFLDELCGSILEKVTGFYTELTDLTSVKIDKKLYPQLATELRKRLSKDFHVLHETILDNERNIDHIMIRKIKNVK